MNSVSVSSGMIPETSTDAMCPRDSPVPGCALPAVSRKRKPRAESIPVPPSLVALPPSPNMMRLHPCFSASATSSPVPKVVVSSGLRSSSRSRVSPEAAATSMMAVPPSADIPYPARSGRISGSWASHSTVEPPSASSSAFIVPSPPSATSRHTVPHTGNTSLTPSETASATSADDSEPLNESDAMTIFLIEVPNGLASCLLHV